MTLSIPFQNKSQFPILYLHNIYDDTTIIAHGEKVFLKPETENSDSKRGICCQQISLYNPLMKEKYTEHFLLLSPIVAQYCDYAVFLPKFLRGKEV